MNDELTRLRAAIASIHNHLHADNVNAAHEACECAMSGGAVSQPNLTIPQSAKAQVFAARFNALCEELDMRAAFVAPASGGFGCLVRCGSLVSKLK